MHALQVVGADRVWIMCMRVCVRVYMCVRVYASTLNMGFFTRAIDRDVFNTEADKIRARFDALKDLPADSG
jgi:hypothetical protein